MNKLEFFEWLEPTIQMKKLSVNKRKFEQHSGDFWI